MNKVRRQMEKELEVRGQFKLERMEARGRKRKTRGKSYLYLWLI